jgi:hypothetical protein
MIGEPFDLSTAYTLCRVCQYAYGISNDVDKELGFNDKHERWFATPTYDGASVYVNDDNVILSFRGTANFQDWLADISISQEVGYGGKVHTGFSRLAQALWFQIKDSVASFPDNLPIFITGHSLGGALASLIGANVKEDFPDRQSYVYTFGCPRVGNNAFANSYKPVHYRVVNNNDVVPCMPMEHELVVGLHGLKIVHWQHTGLLKKLDENGKLMPTLSGGILDFVDNLVYQLEDVLPSNIKSHWIESYVNALGSNI